MSKGHLETDCTRKCKSWRHGYAITSAITKRSVTDETLASFIKATCANFARAFDYQGHTALHMATSRGLSKLVEWLAHHSSDAFVNAKDRESGYTPLHRSVYYGQIHTAVALMKLGLPKIDACMKRIMNVEEARMVCQDRGKCKTDENELGVNTEILDKDDYKAIEHAMLDRRYMTQIKDPKYYFSGVEDPATDVYVWGSNCNYTLGTHNQKTPDLFNCFSRTNVNIEQVCLGKFHSAWLTSPRAGGEVYACGQLARVGAYATTSLRPVLLNLHEPCHHIAVTLDSTVLVLESGKVLQYSLTNNGISQCNNKTPSVIKLPHVKPILTAVALGLRASRTHVCLWTDRAVYTWGTNIGQLGHSKPSEATVDVPKTVPIRGKNPAHYEVGFKTAAVADAATVIATIHGDVYLCHKHIIKKIAVKQLNVHEVCVDAKCNEQSVYSRVTVLLVTNVGQLLLWQDATNKLTRCVFGLSHQTVINSVTLTHDAIYFTTKHGEAYIGHISRKFQTNADSVKKERDRDNKKDKDKGSLVKFLEKDDCTSVRLTRIPNLHRAVSITVDCEEQNFACIQIKSSNEISTSVTPLLSPSSMSKHMESLLDSSPGEDILHDVVFRIGAKRYPAHMFIIASGSEHLYKLYQEKKLQSRDEIPEIVLENILPEVFDRILRYLYTGSCDVMEVGPCGLKIRKDELPKNVKRSNVDDDVDEIENPKEISAFEVYKSTNKTRRRQRSTSSPPRLDPYCEPIRLVQAAAKRLQLVTLQKLLDKFYYRDGYIHLREKASHTKTSPEWARTAYTELCDTRVCTKDGVSIDAHKCVLAQRIEYFRSMFMCSWTESKQQSKVTLPINHGILVPVIDFLYTDVCPEVETSESLDFICSVLIVADQLFINRLKETCEIALANMVTLKNCSELCQFAHTYNADQLKTYCMEFISYNMANFLENRSLEMLDDKVLEDISLHYCKINPIMPFRVITPFFNAPSDDEVNEIAKSSPVDLNVIDFEFKKDESIEVKKKRSKKIEYTENEKARMRYESVSSVNSLDLSHDNSGDITLSLSKMSTKETKKCSRDLKEKWVEVPTAQQKQQKVIQARLKAITSAKDIQNETLTETFVLLGKNNSSAISNSPTDNSWPTTSRMSLSPTDSLRSFQDNFIISHVGPKLSQKQRKRLASQESEAAQIVNLNDYLNKPAEVIPKPKNPWKICEALPQISGSSKSTKQVGFTQILADQKKQKDDHSRIMTKPLNLTQLEDKAIEELEKFYNIHEVDDELITVRRIELQVSCPQWVHNTPK